jgi:serine/threonine protein kinase
MSINPKVFDEIFKEYKNSGDIQDYGKDLGKGALGVVKDVRFKNKAFAGKLVMKDTSEEDRLTQELRGPNIIRIQKICKPKIRGGNTYHLVIMEKAILRDLGKLNNYFHDHNLLKLKIENPFDEPLEDTLLRYYAKQIVDGFETLNRNNYIHFDIKPDNILITVNLTLKLSDFSILKRVDDNVDDFKIPGGTAGYMTPEYYLNQKLTSEGARTQDYFALGSTLFLLKYGLPFLRYKKYEDKKLIADRIIDILSRNINYIEKQELIDDDLIKFLTNLLNYKPEDRYSFEQMYRNKWLNKSFEYIEDVLASFENDEEKLLMEFQKQDFIIKKIKNIRFINEILNKKKRNDSKNGYGKKFTFKKRDLNICSEANIMKLMNNDFIDLAILTYNLSTSKVEFIEKNNLLMNDSLNIAIME